jgi:hypothetical protein
LRDASREPGALERHCNYAVVNLCH